VIIRQVPIQRWATEPSLRVHNARRIFNAFRERISKLNVLQLCLVILGLAGIGYSAYTLVNERVYQSFQNWAFDQGIVGRTDATFAEYLRERTFLQLFIHGNQEPTSLDRAQRRAGVPAHGSVLGRLEIPRLHLSAAVREGVDDEALRGAVGHVPATALAGAKGNFVITAHRDALFRSLKYVGSGDLVTFQGSDGSAYQYRVAATQIVKPSDVNMLRADGGGLITGGGSVQGMPKLLTVITCYPFPCVGSAPKRFVVEAKLVETEELPPATFTTAEQATAEPEKGHKVSGRAGKHQRSPRTRHKAKRRTAKTLAVSAAPAKPVKKSLWRRLIGV
jgi:sortase A